MDLAIQTPPLRRVLGGGLDVLERDGEVNEEEIEVLDTPELELVLSQRFNLNDGFGVIMRPMLHRVEIIRGRGRGRCSRSIESKISNR